MKFQKTIQFIFLTLVSLFFCLPATAQVPQGINFQAIARSTSGVPLGGVPIAVRFTILDENTLPVYQESHNVTTDGFGLFKAVVGQGTPISGTFPAIDWATGQHQVETEIDEGSGFVSTGICPFESVPYALVSGKSDNMNLSDLVDVDTAGQIPGSMLSWNGTQWTTASGGLTPWVNVNQGIEYSGGRIGTGVGGPLKATLHLADTANMLFGQDLTGSGFKMMYYGAKGAFRCGYLTNPFGGYNYDKFWDYDSVGYYSFAAGQNSRAKGFGSFAFGSFGWADGSGSVAFFGHARGNGSFTFGGSSKGRGSITFEGTAEEEGGIAMYGYTGGRYGVSIGGGTTGLGASSSRQDYAIAIGWNSDARGQASIALGPSDAYGYNSFSTGWVTEARGNYSSTFGYRTNSYPYASMALGRYNVITGDSAAWVANDPIFMIGDGTSNTVRSNSFTILKNGRTSIGYNIPTGMLQISSALGSINNGGALDVTNSTLLLGTTTTGMAFDANQIETVGSALNLNYSSPEDVILVNGGGDVAIGHTAPATKLDVSSTGWQFKLGNTGAGGSEWYMGASQNTWASGGSRLVISPTASSANHALVIETSKQIGIGTNSPSDRLQIDADAGENALRVRVAGTTRLRVHSNGGASIGANVTPPAAGLYVNGETRFDANAFPDNDNAYSSGIATRRWTAVYAINGTIQTSDRRDKKDIENLEYGLKEVMKLRPVRYEWKARPQDGQKLGLIAQELDEVLPEVVFKPETDDPEARMGVNYAEVVPVLVKALQEQQELIEKQQQLIENQQNNYESLTAEIEALKAALTTPKSTAK